MVKKSKKKVKPVKSSLRDRILKQLNCTVFLRPQRVWLDSGSPEFNAVMGSKKLGLPAGKLFHLAGKKHGGKTALMCWLAGKAQRAKNAFVIYIEAGENSFSPTWIKKLGVDIGTKETDYANDNFYLIYPKVLKHTKQRKSKKKDVKFDKAGTQFLQSCEYLFAEAEEVMKAVKDENPDRPIVVILDSVAGLQTEMSIELGLTEGNMRSNLERAMFLSKALPRWVDLAKNYTMWVFLINQVRVNPSKMFGDPEYSPGGNGLDHACHVMSLIRRKGAAEAKDGKAKSIAGYMVNKKNKAGGGSYEGAMCSYYVDLQADKIKTMWKFGEIKKKGKDA